MKKKLITLTFIALCTSIIMHGAQQLIPATSSSNFPTLRELCLREVANTVTMDLEQYKWQVAASSSKDNMPHITEQLMNQEDILQKTNDRLPQLFQGDVVLELRKKHNHAKPLLSWAITKNKNDIVQLILSSRINALSDNGELYPLFEIINEQDIKGWTPLMFATEKVHTEIAQALIQTGADLNLQTEFGYTTLMIAAIAGRSEIAQALIQAGADLNLQAYNGWTALISATVKGHIEITQALIQAGANLNLQNNYGRTALMNAAIAGRSEIAQALIQAGADLNLQLNSGWTALMFATEKGHTEIVQALIETGANLNI